MRLNYTKTTAAALWVLAVCAVGVATVTSPTGWFVLAGLALLPFAIGRLWKDEPDMSESIHEAHRRPVAARHISSASSTSTLPATPPR